MSLFHIQNVTQEVAEAISTILGMEVTIIDENYTRVASTGEYKNLIGKRIPSRCVFETVVKDRKPQFVSQDSRDIFCKDCVAQDSCQVLATIGHPIMNNNFVIGVIGVNAFKEHQRDRLVQNGESLMFFLNKLSGLLAGTLSSYETIKKLEIQSQEINKIIDSFRHAVLCIDSKGTIKYINKSAESILNTSKLDITNKTIDELIPGIDNPQILEQEKKFKIKNQKSSFFIKSNKVMLEDIKVSTIMEMHKTSDAIRDAYNLLERKQIFTFDDIVSKNKSIERVKDIANKVAKKDSTILIRGESGTGKELFARAIHFESPRNSAPFIAVNCASIPDNLLESEFFGYEGGAFTGARPQGQIGKFELASGGTLFLDEIGDLPINLQPKILRVLQEHSFTRIGGKDVIETDVRLIAATNKNLEKMIVDGQFREDLYYRLNVIPLYIPPLRERKDDIPLLIDYLLKKYCQKLETQEKVFSEELKQIFDIYLWPGNIREMENLVEYLVNVTKEDIIVSENLPATMHEYILRDEFNHQEMDLKTKMEQYEKQILASMIKKYGETTEAKQRIASILGINLTTLYRKLNRSNL